MSEETGLLRTPLSALHREAGAVMGTDDGWEMPLDYGDITISRKLYRSDLREYHLNGKRVRLKDIKGLLVDKELIY